MNEKNIVIVKQIREAIRKYMTKYVCLRSKFRFSLTSKRWETLN